MMNTPKRKPASKAPAKNKPGPKPGHGGRPPITPGETRPTLAARVRPVTLATFRARADAAGESLGAYLDRLAQDDQGHRATGV